MTENVVTKNDNNKKKVCISYLHIIFSNHPRYIVIKVLLLRSICSNLDIHCNHIQLR